MKNAETEALSFRLYPQINTKRIYTHLVGKIVLMITFYALSKLCAVLSFLYFQFEYCVIDYVDVSCFSVIMDSDRDDHICVLHILKTIFCLSCHFFIFRLNSLH
jgi:hypothetical protein